MPPQKELGRRRLVLAALVLTSLVLVTLFLRETSSGPLHGIQRGGMETMSPIQWVATRAVEPFQNAWRYISGLWSAYEENEKLAAEVERLRDQIAHLRESAEENARLKELLNFQASGIFPEGATFCVARVIGRSPTRWERWILIDKGSTAGVAVNQPVVAAAKSKDGISVGKGLVGKVVAVTAHSAQVQLLDDPGFSAGAVIQDTRAAGIVEGSIAGGLIMDFVERDQLVMVGSTVITSGAGQLFPKGIPIGRVSSVGEEDVNVYKSIAVEPFVDVQAIEEVMVIIGYQQVSEPRELPTGLQPGTGR